jgi:hypothetical protein
MAQHLWPTLMVARSLSADILPVLSGCAAQHACVSSSKTCGMWQLVQLGAMTAPCTCCTHQGIRTRDHGMSEWDGIAPSLKGLSTDSSASRQAPSAAFGVAYIAAHGHEGIHRVAIICIPLAGCLVLLDALYKLIELHQAAAIVVHLQDAEYRVPEVMSGVVAVWWVHYGCTHHHACQHVSRVRWGHPWWLLWSMHACVQAMLAVRRGCCMVMCVCQLSIMQLHEGMGLQVVAESSYVQ